MEMNLGFALEVGLEFEKGRDFVKDDFLVK